MSRAVVIGVLLALGGCVGHQDPVGVINPPAVEDDGDVRELSPPGRPPLPELALPGA